MRLFGDPKKFAIGFALSPDPDGEAGAPALWRETWGDLQVQVAGRNLSQYAFDNAIHNAVTWYLFPVMNWFVENWLPIFHEQRLPTQERYQDARTAFLSAMGRYLRSETDNLVDEEEAWREWSARHHLRAGAAGGIFPDLFMRRFENEVEFSWGDRTEPGFPDNLCFISRRQTIRLPIEDVVAPLYQMLEEFADVVHSDVNEWKHFNTLLGALRQSHFDERLSWFLFGKPDDERSGSLVSSILDKLEPDQRSVLESDIANDNHDFHLHVTSMIAMFGSLSPDFSTADAVKLFAVRARSRQAYEETSSLEDHTGYDPIYHTGPAYQQGYDLALDALDEFGVLSREPKRIDVKKLIEDLGIAIVREGLEDTKTRGVALAGPDCVPTILINTNHEMNAAESGVRFTLAHELCHLLYDRAHGSDLAHPSGQWAPAAVERRANAFGAMFLMPEPYVRELFDAHEQCAGLHDKVGSIARTLDVGFIATAEHLSNLDIIDEDDRLLLISNQRPH